LCGGTFQTRQNVDEESLCSCGDSKLGPPEYCVVTPILWAVFLFPVLSGTVKVLLLHLNSGPFFWIEL